jgi:hypothetical protein
VSPHANRKPIESWRYATWELGFEIRMEIVMREMNQIRALGADLLGDGQ